MSFRTEESGDGQNRFHAGEQLRGGSRFQGGEPPRHDNRFPTGDQPRREERFPTGEQVRRDERFPTGEQVRRDERFPAGEQVRRDEASRAGDARQADLAGKHEADYEHRQVIDPRRMGTHAAGAELGTVTGPPLEPVVPPVERRPAAHSRPDEPVAEVRREEHAAPEVPAEEPHGLGWLLSMSGLGATTPVPEAEVEPEAEPEVVPEVRPQGWFAPAIESDEEAETDNPTPEEPSAEHMVAEEQVAQQFVADEPAAPQPPAEEPISDRLASAEPVGERLVPAEPVGERAVSDEALVAEQLTVRSIAQDLPISEPSVEDFVVQHPFGAELVTSESLAEERIAEEPAVDVTPVAEEPPVDVTPVVEESAVDVAPVVEEPADRPLDAVIVDMPVPDEFVADEPLVVRHLAQVSLEDEPLAETPVAGGPILVEPFPVEGIPFEPIPVEPDLSAPEAIEPDAAAPEAIESDVAAPDMVAPDMVAPDVIALNMAAPDVIAPDVAGSDLAETGLGEPGTDVPVVGEVEAYLPRTVDADIVPEAEEDVAVEEPDFDRDFAEFQTFGELTADEPATGEPATGEPATGEPATGEPAAHGPEFDQPFADFQSFGVSAFADEPSDEPAAEPIAEPATKVAEAAEPAAEQTEEPAAVVVTTSLAETVPVEESAPLTALVAAEAGRPVEAVLGSRLSERGQAASGTGDQPALGVPKREPVRQRRDQRSVGDRRRADPEEILASYAWTFDPETLREQVDEPDRLGDLIDRLTDRLEFAERDNVRAGLLSLRAVVSRVLGDLDEALDDAREAVRHAETSGELRPISIAQARLAHVLQWRGEFDEADRLYAQADSVELPSRTRAEIFELAGRSAFEQGRFLEAVNHFERALDVRQGGDPELIERVEMALDAISRKTASQSWGPYPRSRDELLGRITAPMPLLDDGAGLWGFAAAVEPRFAEVRPFTEGVAWVRRPDSPAWELIDPSGKVLINREYLQVAPFAEGLAWVSRQPRGGWFVIDRQNRAVVNGQFEDARPFRRGIALIQQGGVWGALDRHGRIAVPPGWPAFATTLHIGGELDGFSDEGLAVVSAGERLGVLDRTGRLVVEPFFEKVVIHPSAFLVSQNGRWGALTRKGEPMIDLIHEDRAAAVEAINEEARPVL
ncbi:WG repeat-containing protein [Actinoplanes sp. CA-015351]|uniref:WG repeat-containing protein n=1 Tax=Actinoplanes sp. CA-015351 TaxID=3239897 RepID=UPI003D9800DA